MVSGYLELHKFIFYIFHTIPTPILESPVYPQIELFSLTQDPINYLNNNTVWDIVSVL